jgi:nucleoside-diphosphate-sugar epimerase
MAQAMVGCAGGGGKLVAVVGASGNVGKLVALRLADSCNVRAIVRDKSRVATFLDRPNIELFEADVSGEGAKLQAALAGTSTVVVCTGTTAFPTKAWSTTEESSVSGTVLSALLDNQLDVKAALRALDAQGLNTPENVDNRGVKAVLDAWQAGPRASGPRRFVLMSSIGVTKRDGFPFKILNACGVLDAKAAGEAHVIAGAAQHGFDYSIVRPGQLFGGPYDNNYYLGTLFQLDKDAATQGVQLARGDTLLGDTLRSTLAEVLARVVELDAPSGCDFTVVNQKGTPPTADEVAQRLRAV